MRIVSLLLLALVAGSLQGCFPVVAAGAGAGVFMANDRRTSGAYIEDEAIEDKSASLIDKQYKNKVHVNVTSFNRNVLISGEVPSEADKAGIGRLISSVQNVRNINNELVISAPSGLSSRSSDSLITSDVKLRFMRDKRFSADHVKVVTENGTVFLMGIVKHAEADAATDVASTTGGAQRVVKLFEYLD
ncbi:MAG TPA: BON domain-containing protein [Gallionella sp.]|nr:BON domain-containing protein [Gallionella sp.]